MSNLDQLQDDARIWIFGGHESFDSAQTDRLQNGLNSFVSQWTAHGSPLAAGFGFIERRFVVVGVNPGVPPSGCSIDRLFRIMQEAEREIRVPLLDSTSIYFRTQSGEVAAASRADFRQRVELGEVTAQTSVFDTTIETMSQFRGNFEKRAADSWHAAAFGIEGSF